MKKVLRKQLNTIQWGGVGCFLGGIILIFFNELVEYIYKDNTAYPGILINILKNYLPNFSTDLIFAAFTIFILDYFYQKEAEEKEKRDLIFRMGSANNAVATDAARQLKNGDFWMISLEGKRFDGADLSGADFRKANLRNTDLMDTNLTGAKMENAHLEGAVIIDTNLNNANLRNTHFSGATIRSTKKELHIFEGANLYRANFEGAIFSVLIDEKLVVDESIELRHAYRLNHATMPNGKRYDGRYNLSGDNNQPGIDINDDNCMADFYGVTLEDYQMGQKWYMENILSSRTQIF
jgi:uncharacterized protein YjbI with pentapeptide repeats